MIQLVSTSISIPDTIPYGPAPLHLDLEVANVMGDDLDVTVTCGLVCDTNHSAAGDSDNVVVRNLVNLVHTMNQNGHNVNVHYSSENFSGRLFFRKRAQIYSVYVCRPLSQNHLYSLL